MKKSTRAGGNGVDSRRNFDRTVGDDVPRSFLVVLAVVFALIVGSILQWSCS
jgi:hypothetical protein